jgi:hypothetical protein
MMGEGLGNHPLANFSAVVCGRWDIVRPESGGVRFPRLGDGGWTGVPPASGVIRGKGKPAANIPPPDDVEVLLPQLELRLPAVQLPSSSARTVNKRVKSRAFVGTVGLVRGMRCNFVVMPL